MNRKDRVEKAIQFVEYELNLHKRELRIYESKQTEYSDKLTEWTLNNTDLLRERDEYQKLGEGRHYLSVIEKIPPEPKAPIKPLLNLKRLESIVKGKLVDELIVSERLANELLRSALRYHKLVWAHTHTFVDICFPPTY